MSPEFVADRLDESQPAIPSPRHALQTDRIVQPALIEEVCGAVWTSGPCQLRDGADYKANVLYIYGFFGETWRIASRSHVCRASVLSLGCQTIKK